MLTADMSGQEIAAVAASLRESNPDLAALLTDSPTPAVLAQANAILYGAPAPEVVDDSGPFSEEAEPPKKKGKKAKK